MLGRRPASWVTTALLSGALMMLLDVVIDPLAVRGDRWFLGRIFYYPDGGAYFGVPLSNFVGWWIVGGLGIAAYAACGGLARARLSDRVGPGIALYYAVLAFNLAVTGWIGEWRLMASGAAVHAVLALALAAAVRRAPATTIVDAGGMQRA